MRWMLRMALAALPVAACVATAALGEDDRSGLTWLSGDEIRAEFSGRSLAGLYPSEKSWSERIDADGSTDYREGEKHWQGRWWVRNREFCFSYAPPGVGGCFRVTRISANCFELYEHDGERGQSEEPPDIANQWNGRMWHADRPTTCENRPTV